jgi:hypothetical protein
MAAGKRSRNGQTVWPAAIRSTGSLGVAMLPEEDEQICAPKHNK